MSTVKINTIKIENTKRVKAIKMEPTANGLTVIGGRNQQGKTSVLDAIAWALGGERYRPSNAKHEGSTIPPKLHVKLSNGLIVERRGVNSSLYVTDPSGQTAGQTLLNSFVEQFAIDLPRFLNASNRDKAETLLRIIGVGEQLAELEQTEKQLYDQRRAIGQIADQKKKFAAEQPYHPDAPEEPVSASDLIKQQQEILARNGENQRKREQVDQIKASIKQQAETIDFRQDAVEEARRKLSEAEKALSTAKAGMTALQEDLRTAQKTAETLVDESTAELEANIANIEEINNKVTANLNKDRAEDEAREYQRQYDELSAKITDVRKQKSDLLDGAELPYPGLSVDDGELTYKGKKWDGMADSEKLIVSASIVRKLNPKCGFILLDGLERLDVDTLNQFGHWLESEGLQAIATRVGTGDEATLIIEDGYVKGQEGISFYEDEEPAPEDEPANNWKAGEF